MWKSPIEILRQWFFQFVIWLWSLFIDLLAVPSETAFFDTFDDAIDDEREFQQTYIDINAKAEAQKPVSKDSEESDEDELIASGNLTRYRAIHDLVHVHDYQCELHTDSDVNKRTENVPEEDEREFIWQSLLNKYTRDNSNDQDDEWNDQPFDDVKEIPVDHIAADIFRDGVAAEEASPVTSDELDKMRELTQHSHGEGIAFEKSSKTIPMELHEHIGSSSDECETPQINETCQDQVDDEGEIIQESITFNVGESKCKSRQPISVDGNLGQRISKTPSPTYKEWKETFYIKANDLGCDNISNINYARNDEDECLDICSKQDKPAEETDQSIDSLSEKSDNFFKLESEFVNQGYDSNEDHDSYFKDEIGYQIMERDLSSPTEYDLNVESTEYDLNVKPTEYDLNVEPTEYDLNVEPCHNVDSKETVCVQNNDVKTFRDIDAMKFNEELDETSQLLDENVELNYDVSDHESDALIEDINIHNDTCGGNEIIYDARNENVDYFSEEDNVDDMTIIHESNIEETVLDKPNIVSINNENIGIDIDDGNIYSIKEPIGLNFDQHPVIETKCAPHEHDVEDLLYEELIMDKCGEDDYIDIRYDTIVPIECINNCELHEAIVEDSSTTIQHADIGNFELIDDTYEEREFEEKLIVLDEPLTVSHFTDAEIIYNQNIHVENTNNNFDNVGFLESHFVCDESNEHIHSGDMQPDLQSSEPIQLDIHFIETSCAGDRPTEYDYDYVECEGMHGDSPIMNDESISTKLSYIHDKHEVSDPDKFVHKLFKKESPADKFRFEETSEALSDLMKTADTTDAVAQDLLYSVQDNEEQEFIYDDPVNEYFINTHTDLILHADVEEGSDGENFMNIETASGDISNYDSQNTKEISLSDKEADMSIQDKTIHTFLMTSSPEENIKFEYIPSPDLRSSSPSGINIVNKDTNSTDLTVSADDWWNSVILPAESTALTSGIIGNNPTNTDRYIPNVEKDDRDIGLSLFIDEDYSSYLDVNKTITDFPVTNYRSGKYQLEDGSKTYFLDESTDSGQEQVSQFDPYNSAEIYQKIASDFDQLKDDIDICISETSDTSSRENKKSLLFYLDKQRSDYLNSPELESIHPKMEATEIYSELYEESPREEKFEHNFHQSSIESSVIEPCHLTAEEEEELRTYLEQNEAEMPDLTIDKFLQLPDSLTEKEISELEEDVNERGAVRQEELRGMQRYLDMPVSLNEQEQNELQQLLLEEQAAAAPYVDPDSDDLQQFLSMPTALTEDEERLFGDNDDRYEDEESFRQSVRDKFLLQLEDDVLRLDEEDDYFEDDDEADYGDEEDNLSESEDFPTAKPVGVGRVREETPKVILVDGAVNTEPFITNKAKKGTIFETNDTSNLHVESVPKRPARKLFSFGAFHKKNDL